MLKPNLSLLIVVIIIFSACAHKSERADLIIRNARIQSVNPTMQQFSAMAVKDGKVLELGAEQQILNKYQSDSVIDMGMMFVYPGFIDAHCHFLGYGRFLQQVNLVGTKSFEEVVRRCVDHDRTHRSEWLVGRGWDQNDWDVQEFPNKAILDSLFPEKPVLIRRIDGHAALANSRALDLAGIQPGDELVGGEIVVENGELTGILIDNAVDLVRDIIPDHTMQEDVRSLMEAQRDCFAVGLTTVDDAGLEKVEIELIDSLQQSGELKMRVYAMISDEPENYEYYLDHGPIKTERLNVRSFKVYSDGALGSRGACLIEPYSDVVNNNHFGFLLDSLTYFKEVAQRIYDGGFQMATHCIGDSANRVILDVYGEILGGTNDRRWRIEHAQVVHKGDIDKFGEYNIIPSVQPTHATSDMYWAEQRLGRNRVRRAYAYQELKRQLGLVALGTDFPIEGINPMNTFYAATVRKDADRYPEGGFNMENALTREEALMGMTIWAAVSNFEEEEKGSLEPGKWADFVVLDKDILKAGADDLLDTKVMMTFVQGEKVFERK